MAPDRDEQRDLVRQPQIAAPSESERDVVE